MSFLDWLVGGGSTKTSTNQNQKGTQFNTSQTRLTGNELSESSQQTGAVTASDQATQSTQQQQTLDAETQEQLRAIIGMLSGQVGQGPDVLGGSQEGLDFARLFADRAAGADEAIASSFAPILTDARRQVEQNLGQVETNLKSAAGSGLNSAVIALSNRARGDAETQLARLSAELGLQGRGIATGEFQGAAKALGDATTVGTGVGRSSVQDIASLADILKGSNVEQVSDVAQLGRTETQETINQVSQMQRILEELGVEFNISDISKTGTSKEKDSGSLMDWVDIFY